jgi:hypothetical protein
VLQGTFRGWAVWAALSLAACGKSGEGPGASSPSAGAPVAPEAAASPTQEESQPFLATTGPGWPSPELVRLLRFLDTRQSATGPRARAAVVAELNGLERLVETAAKDSPDRLRLLHRIAEDYVELRSAAMRDELRLSGSEAEQASAQVSAARTQAIAHYQLLLEAFPSYGDRDDVFFGLAIEYGWSNDLKRLRENLFFIIREAPRSRYIPLAYFVFGEMFFAEAATDSLKKPLAVAAFKEVLRYPSPPNRALCLSRERLARLAGSPRSPQEPLNYDEPAACALHIPDPQGTDEILLSE